MDNWEEAAIAALKAYWHPDDPAYTNWQMDIFLAGYRAALAAREAEVERLRSLLQEIGESGKFDSGRLGMWSIRIDAALADPTA